MSSRTTRERSDPRALVEAWLIDGARDELARDLAVHASLCGECRMQIVALDLLTAVELERAGFPPPRAATAPARARRRVAVAAGGVVALSAVATAAAVGWRLPGNGLGSAATDAPTQDVLGNTGQPESSSTVAVTPSATASGSASAEVTTSPSPTPGVPVASGQPPIIVPTASPHGTYAATPSPPASIKPPSATPTASPSPTAEVSSPTPTPTDSPIPSGTPAPLQELWDAITPALP